tara:strand:- start:22701 stop:23177 length:477 start_codon:yes stop_codon:yes gene_type:complete
MNKIMFLWEKRMAKKSLDDWRKAWDDAPGSFEKKTSVLLRQYVLDSKTGVAGTLSPMTWFAVSERKNVQYLSANPVEQAFKQIVSEHGIKVHEVEVDVAFLLWHVKHKTDEFYDTNFPELSGICEGDELFHVLLVIQEQTGVDYFAIHGDSRHTQYMR